MTSPKTASEQAVGACVLFSSFFCCCYFRYDCYDACLIFFFYYYCFCTSAGQVAADQHDGFGPKGGVIQPHTPPPMLIGVR